LYPPDPPRPVPERETDSLTRGRDVDTDIVTLNGSTGGPPVDETAIGDSETVRLAPNESVARTAGV